MKETDSRSMGRHDIGATERLGYGCVLPDIGSETEVSVKGKEEVLQSYFAALR